MKNVFTGVAALALIAGAASASVRFNEVFINPPGTDQGFEFIELKGTAGMSLSGLTVLFIEGDGTGAGVIDGATSLNSLSIGSNGLFLWRDAANILDADAATAGTQGPDAGTSIFVQDFNPDIENGSFTYMIVSGFTGSLTQDLDTNDDGIFDITPWSSIVDSVALRENDGGNNFGYAGANNFGPHAGFNADHLQIDQYGTLIGSDVVGSAAAGFTFDLPRMAPYLANGWLTPGSENYTPTPGSLALVAIGGLIATRRRRA